MSNGNVNIEQIPAIPDSSFDLLDNELFVRLGCDACPNSVCFKATGITSRVPESSTNPESARNLSDVVDGVRRRSEVLRGTSSVLFVGSKVCLEPCPQVEEVAAAVELIGEEFGTILQIPQG